MPRSTLTAAWQSPCVNNMFFVEIEIHSEFLKPPVSQTRVNRCVELEFPGINLLHVPVWIQITTKDF